MPVQRGEPGRRAVHEEEAPGWRRDPRIRPDQQIDGGCYGNAPRFSRGHMTRREDPVWGTSESAARGNSDSMHVTNAVPQMQTFNGGIWLGLEDYALDHAREDRMRISVFTGPVLREDDPIRFGVQIPTTFWKVIAFEHDQTGELCATGYTMAQDDFLRRRRVRLRPVQDDTGAAVRDRGAGGGDLPGRPAAARPAGARPGVDPADALGFRADPLRLSGRPRVFPTPGAVSRVFCVRLPADEPTPDWQQVKDLFAGALERTPRDRDAYLAAQGEGNQALVASVRDLLGALEEARDFLESQDPSTARRSRRSASRVGRRWPSAPAWARIRSSSCSTPAAWARSTARATTAWAVTSR